MVILNNILEKSINDTLKYYQNPTFIMDSEKYSKLFSNIYRTYQKAIKYNLPGKITRMIVDSENEISVLFYYFIYHLFFPKQILLQDINSVSDLYTLFTILLEKSCSTTMIELKIQADTHNLIENYISLYSLVDEVFEMTSCDDISCQVDQHLTETQILVHGGDGINYIDLQELLKKVLEPRHDFGKSDRNTFEQIRKKFSREYKGEFDNFVHTYDRVVRNLEGYISNGNPFYNEPSKIRLIDIINSDNFEANTFSYFHNFIDFCRFPQNSSPQLFKYITIKGPNVSVNSIYSLKKEEIDKQVISICAFQKVIFCSNNINYHMDDITPDAEVRTLYDTGYNEIVSAASLWDPNSKVTIAPADFPFKQILQRTFLEVYDTLPKRILIESGNIQLKWKVVFVPENNRLVIRVLSIIDKVSSQEYIAEITKSIGVSEISKLMNYIENDIPLDKPDESTILIFTNIIRPIKQLDGVSLANKKNVLFALVLDFKLSGDWGQSNWIDEYNKIHVTDKCMLVTKDKLCGLESILIGIPTLVSNVKNFRDTITKQIKKVIKKDEGIDKITELIGKYNCIIYQGNTNGITSGYVVSILSNCYSKIYSTDILRNLIDISTRLETLDIDFVRRQYEVISIFFDTDLPEIIRRFNADGKFLESIINKKEPYNTSQPISTDDSDRIFRIAKNMDKFATLIHELEYFLNNIGNIQNFIDKAHEFSIAAMGWSISQSGFNEFLLQVQSEVPKTVPKRASGRSGVSKDAIIKQIMEIDPAKICETLNSKFTTRDSAIERTNLQLFFSLIGNLHTEMMGLHIKSLFGSIYCKLIDECDYIDGPTKIKLKNKLFMMVTSPRDIDETNKEALIIRFQRILFIIKCIIVKKEGTLSVMSKGDNISKKLIANLQSIVNEMEHFLRIPEREHTEFIPRK